MTPDLAKPFAPGIDAAGAIEAEAKLTGTTAAPAGTVRLTATGLRMRTGPARALPPANVTATMVLAGKSATVDARLAAGRSNLTVTGRAPLGAGALALRATGGVDLALLDPVLSPEGRRARGQVSLDAGVTGQTSGAAGERHADAGRRRGAGFRPGRARHRHRRDHPGQRRHGAHRQPDGQGGPRHDRRQRQRRPARARCRWTSA